MARFLLSSAAIGVIMSRTFLVRSRCMVSSLISFRAVVREDDCSVTVKGVIMCPVRNFAPRGRSPAAHILVR